jgi:hypothetical protein
MDIWILDTDMMDTAFSILDYCILVACWRVAMMYPRALDSPLLSLLFILFATTETAMFKKDFSLRRSSRYLHVLCLKVDNVRLDLDATSHHTGTAYASIA